MRLPGILRPACLGAAFLAGLVLHPTATPGATFEPIRHDGLPLIQLPGSTNAAGFRLVGAGVVYARQDVDARFQGIFSTRGEASRALVLPGDADPTPGATNRLRVIQPLFDVETATVGSSVSTFVFAAGDQRPDALFLHDGSSLRRVLGPGTPLPNSGGLTVSRFGPPHFATGTTIVRASSSPDPDAGFQGIYRIEPPGPDGSTAHLLALADAATPLPGPVDRPAYFAENVGFDGTNVAFQAAQGPPEQPGNQGLFIRGRDGTITPLLGTGDPLPGGGSVDWLDFAPVLRAGVAAAVVNDTDGRFRVVRFESGTATAIAREGDPAPEGGTLTLVGLTGLVVDGPRTYFGARTSVGPGIYVSEGGRVTGLVTGGRFPLSATTSLAYPEVILGDVKGAGLVLQWADNRGAPVSGLAATLPQPSIPVFVRVPAATNLPPGGRLELRATVLGDPPLRFLWANSQRTYPDATGDTLIVESVGALDSGDFTLTVTNAYGKIATDKIKVTVTAPPLVTLQPEPLILTPGDPFQFRCQISSSGPYGVRWRRNGTLLPDSGPTLLRQTSTLEDAGIYDAVITNAWGTTLTTPATLTLRLPPPGPEYGGRRIVSLFGSGDAVFSASLPSLSADSIDPLRMRWLDDHLVLAGAKPDGSTPAILTNSPDGLAIHFRTGNSLSNGLGSLTIARVIPAHAEDPLVLLGGNVGVFRGIYRLDGSTLVPLADLTTPAPAAPGGPIEPFTAFPGPARQSGQRVAFVAQTATRTGVFTASPDGLRLIADTTQNLTAAGGITNFTAVACDADTVAAVGTGRTTFGAALYRFDAAGQGTPILVTGQNIPGSTPAGSVIAAFDPPIVEAGAVFSLVRDVSGFRTLLRWEDGRLSLVASTNRALGDGSTLVRLDSASLAVDAGRVFFTGLVRSPSRTRSTLLMAVRDGDSYRIDPVLSAADIITDELNQLLVLGVAGDRLAFAGVTTGRLPRVVVYANLGLPSRPAPLLRLDNPAPGSVVATVPDGALVETTTSLLGPWDYLPATGSVPLGVPGPGGVEPVRFYRLRWP